MSIKITHDGRTLRTGRDYTEFRRYVFTYQGGHCDNPDCEVDNGRPTGLLRPLEWDDSFHLNHLYGRGGGKRDDVLFRDDGKQMVRGECGKCHRVSHGQQEKITSQPQWSRA